MREVTGIVLLYEKPEFDPDSAAPLMMSGRPDQQQCRHGRPGNRPTVPPAKANSDLMVEIGIRQKSRSHALGA
jgi:hypothetical protein